MNSQLTSRRGFKSPLSDREIQSRIECPESSLTLNIESTHVRYAYVSQRGYYPDAVSKENQDCYTTIPSMKDVMDCSFFAVYDGHGKEGHHCARYVRDHLPAAVHASLLATTNRSRDAITDMLHNIHISTNKNLHADQRVDDSLSGTTSISILFCGRTMYVSNVGDSRAIIVSEEDGKLKARPLSSDQTPYRKDERERVKKYGARVMSMDQIEGIEPIHENWGDINLGEEIDEGGDPPRIWSPNGAYPGTAFTRSFGDMYAEELGVTAEPEILVRDLHRTDRYLVIASDGIFEFLTNQMVADMVSQRADPLDACRAIVAQSYELWLQYEVRTDDITIIALYLEGNDALAGASTNGTATVNDIELSEDITNRPVRRVISREKRKVMIQAQWNTTARLTVVDSEEVYQSKRQPKTPEETERILLAISDNFLFHHLSETQREQLVEVFQRVPVNAEQWIIRQGDVGDLFYIVDSGTYEVRVASAESNEEGGSVVHMYESGPDRHPCFGELSLMYGKPRAASIRATTDGALWALDHSIFTHAVLRTQDMRRTIIRTLRNVELLRCLNLVQLQRLVDVMADESFKAGDKIISQGEEGDKFFVIVRGSCKCVVRSNTDSPGVEGKVVAQLGSNDYFGERALLNAEPRAASVIAASDVEVLSVGKAGFEEVLGRLSNIIAADQSTRERTSALRLQHAPRRFAAIKLNGFISTGQFGSTACASFNSQTPNLCVKSTLLNAKGVALVKHDISTALEALHVMASSSVKPNCIVAKLLALYRDRNVFHFVLSNPIVTDLASLSPKVECNHSKLPYVAASVINALEYLHSVGIVYRNVQPEGINVDFAGRIVLIDFDLCKVGGVGNRTYTICGVPDYLSPEQISQQGHDEAVDLWSLGVSLYELACHENPFSYDSANEVTIFSRITSLGPASIPINESLPAPLMDLIQKLIVPNPSNRLGMGTVNMTALKHHNFFDNIRFDSNFIAATSPLRNVATSAKDDWQSGSEEMAAVTAKWNESIADSDWADDLLLF